jgi:signal transduction histidine kinase
VKRFWPLPLWVELVAAVMLALLVTNAATGLFFRMAWQGSVEQRFRTQFAERAAHSIAAILAASGAEERERLLKAMSGPGQRVSISALPQVPRQDAGDTSLAALIASVEPSLAGREIRVSREHRAPRWRRDFRAEEDGEVRALAVMTLSVSAQDGTWINADFDLPVPFDPTFPLILSGGILIAMLTLISLFVSRRVVQPLKALETAARAMGPGDPPAPVPERGPMAVKAAIRSFNAMSQRLLTTLDSQRTIMAAVAHDLRSPITSLRLRAEFVGEPETKERMLATLDEMQTMTEAVIDLARAGKSSEAARPIDLNALADSIVEDMTETAPSLSFTAGPPATATIRRSEVTRALRNLLENAERYGGGATVSLEVLDGYALIHIDDEGPGVPEDQLEALFMPFSRLEGSRNKETGGHGLGLTIARMIARGHGGDVTLANRTPKGLRATLRLPLAGV